MIRDYNDISDVQGFINTIELAIDWNIPVTAEEYELYLYLLEQIDTGKLKPKEYKTP